MTVEARRRIRGGGSSRFAYVSFAVMVGGWLAFLVAGLSSEPTLDDAWTAIRDLPLLTEAVAWLLGFPFLVGLAVWQAPWNEDLRVVAIVALALAYIAVFVPRSATR